MMPGSLYIWCWLWLNKVGCMHIFILVASWLDMSMNFPVMPDNRKYFTRTKVFSRALFQNKAVCISLRITVMLRIAISRGLRGGSNLLAVLNENSFKGYECVPWSIKPSRKFLSRNFFCRSLWGKGVRQPKRNNFCPGGVIPAHEHFWLILRFVVISCDLYPVQAPKINEPTMTRR